MVKTYKNEMLKFVYFLSPICLHQTRASLFTHKSCMCPASTGTPTLGEGLFIFRDLGSIVYYFQGSGEQAHSFGDSGSPTVKSKKKSKQEGQEALNRSTVFYLKLSYKYLLKAGHVPGDTSGGAYFGPRGII